MTYPDRENQAHTNDAHKRRKRDMFNWKKIVQAIKHQKWFLVLTVVLLGGGGAFGIASLPDVYESGARILVERRGLFSETEMMTGAAQDNVSRRLHAIASLVLSTNSLHQIMQDHDLVNDDLPPEDLDSAIQDFREKAVLDFDNVAVVNQFTGKAGMYSQGLKVAFEHTDPDVAFGVAKTLTDRVLAANRGKGEADVEFRRTFLTEQFTAASEKLTASKQAIAKFKNENALFLPEVHALTIRRYEEIETQSSRIEDSVARLRRDLSDVRGELGTTSADAFVLAADGTRILGSDEQLRLLEAQYARAKSRYTDNHPQLIKLESELEGLRRYVSGADTTGIEADLQQARKELASAKQRYGDQHPDVRALVRRTEMLASLLAQRQSVERPTQPKDSSNPAYNRLLIREKGIIDDIALERQKYAGLQTELATIKDQLARMPTVEQELDTLLQRQEAANTRYEEIEVELEQLDLSVGMQQADLLDRFILIEPPRRPFAPAKPPKKLLAGLLGLLALAAGLLAALLIHMYRDLILDRNDIAELVDLPVCMIPKLG